MRLCVIGAGPSGLAAAQALKANGIPFDCFEKRDRIGGLWAFSETPGESAAYRSLNINTSRERTQFAAFPMDAGTPDFPHHTQMAAYFNAYADHFGLREHIRLNTAVTRAERLSDGRWAVTLESGEVGQYDGLIVANGHHWDPRWPEPPFPGEFHGTVMHAHTYQDNRSLAGKRVLILGIGNSASDIAVESSFVAEKTFLAMRRGAYVVPRYLFGMPYDQVKNPGWLPWKLRQPCLELAYRLGVGKVEQYGMPRPDHHFGEAHPTVSDYLLARVTHGYVTPKPNIAELQGDRVRFVDGSVEQVDLIIYCTGYQVTFPFFDPDFLSAPGNELPLFRRVFKPGIDNLFFIGLLQPLGSIMPLAEAQAHWVAEYLTGRYTLPSEAEMQADIAREEAAIKARYVPSARHTMQVDFDTYLYQLAQERRRGARRAKQ
ncbi:MAG: flavin-containing monooxygenase [Bacillota bacterium]